MQEENSIERVNAIKSRNEDWLLQLPGVVGVMIGRSSRSDARHPASQPVIKVLIASARDLQHLERSGRIPDNLDGVPVELQETGEFRAY